MTGVAVVVLEVVSVVSYQFFLQTVKSSKKIFFYFIDFEGIFFLARALLMFSAWQ